MYLEKLAEEDHVVEIDLGEEAVGVVAAEEALLLEQIAMKLKEIAGVLGLGAYELANGADEVALLLEHGARLLERLAAQQALRVVLGLEVALERVHEADERLGLVVHAVALLGQLEEALQVAIHQRRLHVLHGRRIAVRQAHVVLELLHVPLRFAERVRGHVVAVHAVLVGGRGRVEHERRESERVVDVLLHVRSVVVVQRTQIVVGAEAAATTARSTRHRGRRRLICLQHAHLLMLLLLLLLLMMKMMLELELLLDGALDQLERACGHHRNGVLVIHCCCCCCCYRCLMCTRGGVERLGGHVDVAHRRHYCCCCCRLWSFCRGRTNVFSNCTCRV